MPQIQRVFDENRQIYGARKIWLGLRRQGIRVAHCTVIRLMRRMGLQEARRKTELVHRRGPWKSRQQLELTSLGWVHWFNNQRLLSSIGDIPPVEAEAKYFSQLAIERASEEAITLTNQSPCFPG